MDLFAPVVGGLMLLLLIVDHSILGHRIEKLEREVKEWELSERLSGRR